MNDSRVALILFIALLAVTVLLFLNGSYVLAIVALIVGLVALAVAGRR